MIPYFSSTKRIEPSTESPKLSPLAKNHEIAKNALDQKLTLLKNQIITLEDSQKPTHKNIIFLMTEANSIYIKEFNDFHNAANAAVPQESSESIIQLANTSKEDFETMKTALITQFDRINAVWKKQKRSRGPLETFKCMRINSYTKQAFKQHSSDLKKTNYLENPSKPYNSDSSYGSSSYGSSPFDLFNGFILGALLF